MLSFLRKENIVAPKILDAVYCFNNDEKLFLLNEILKEFSAKNSIDIIKLDEIYKQAESSYVSCP